MSGKFNSKVDEYLHSFYLGNDVKFLKNIKTGCIVKEDNEGFVTAEYFDDIDSLEDEWERIVKMYDNYYEDLEIEEILEDQDDEAAWNDPNYFRKP